MNSQATISAVDGEVRLRVRGEIDMDVAPEIRARTSEAFTLADSRPVVIDLGDCTFMDSSGLEVLVTAARTARASRQSLRITGAHGVVMRVIELTDLASVLPIEA